MGLLAAAIGALYSVYATYGLARGLKSADMTPLRTSVAGILTLPVLVYYLRFDAKVLTGQWRRWLGHIPTLTEAIGMTLAIVGLLVTVTYGVSPDSRSSQT